MRQYGLAVRLVFLHPRLLQCIVWQMYALKHGSLLSVFRLFAIACDTGNQMSEG